LRGAGQAEAAGHGQEPLVVAFYESFIQRPDEPRFAPFADRVQGIRKALHAWLNDGVGQSPFRADLDAPTAAAYLGWLMDGYERDLTARFERAEVSAWDEAAMAAEWARFDRFMDHLRLLFYRKDGPDGGGH
jgi:hypothetical protein